MQDPTSAPRPLHSWRAPLVDDLERVAVRRRYGLALMGAGWIHLASFAVCQWLYGTHQRASLPFLLIWLLELIAILWMFRKVAGKGYRVATPLADIVFRTWATFLVLSFNIASMNSLTDVDHQLYKAIWAWATLSAFVFMMLAYLINLRYIWLAAQMYFTGLFMAHYPQWSYLTYGLSWCVSLHVIGVILERRRALGARTGEAAATTAKADHEPVAV